MAFGQLPFLGIQPIRVTLWCVCHSAMSTNCGITRLLSAISLSTPGSSSTRLRKRSTAGGRAASGSVGGLVAANRMTYSSERRAVLSANESLECGECNRVNRESRITLGIYGHVAGDAQREAVEKHAERIEKYSVQ